MPNCSFMPPALVHQIVITTNKPDLASLLILCERLEFTIHFAFERFQNTAKTRCVSQTAISFSGDDICVRMCGYLGPEPAPEPVGKRG